ncbi:hypothetical protein [Romboutsia sp.]|uniref:hypothetical protein n=1 Tax=Romboutsia sp. TaxID=1965302 RepID=UPI003F308325
MNFKKRASKSIALALAGISVIVPVLNASYAYSPNMSIEIANSDKVDIYAEEILEVVEIEGVEYTYKYSYDSEGNQVTEIRSENSENSEILVFDKESSEFILDGEVIGSIEQTYNANSMEGKSTGTADWPHFSSSSKKVSWKAGTSVSSVATIMAAAFSFLGPSGVIQAMGSALLANLANNSIGGTIYQDIHKFNSTVISNYKNTWKFTASTGQVCGPYVYMFN